MKSPLTTSLLQTNTNEDKVIPYDNLKTNNYLHMKHIFKLLLASSMLQLGFAQQTFNTEFKTKTLQVFQNLDKNKNPIRYVIGLCHGV